MAASPLVMEKATNPTEQAENEPAAQEFEGQGMTIEMEEPDVPCAENILPPHDPLPQELEGQGMNIQMEEPDIPCADNIVPPHAPLSQALLEENSSKEVPCVEAADQNEEKSLEQQVLEPKQITVDEIVAKGIEKLQDPEVEEVPPLAIAHQQIAGLNSQLAHLYTELTKARTEVQVLRAQQSDVQPSAQTDISLEVQKQSQQIADLVSDIRHLQLDLEYHQQKLDQMLEEKQLMIKEIKKYKAELTEAKQQIDERDQMLKHREVDLAHLKRELKSPNAQSGGAVQSGDAIAALRAEAAAKDSSLIVSHYALHKEKLLRDRLEKNNLKLLERMQKLMMVVETVRKENICLERNLAAKKRVNDEKSQQLQQMTQKVRQLQKTTRITKGGQKTIQRSVTEFDSQSQVLPPLDRSQRSIDMLGRRSGMSTPRAPPSPYSVR